MSSSDRIIAPSGMSGLAVEPWSAGEVYAVAADWRQASAPVYALDSAGMWYQTGRRVADYSHREMAALRDELARAIVSSGDEPTDDELRALVIGAVPIEDDEYYPCCHCEGTGTIEDDEHGDCTCSYCVGTGEAQ